MQPPIKKTTSNPNSLDKDVGKSNRYYVGGNRMTAEQAKKELSYRVAMLKVQKLLDDGFITKNEFVKLRKKLIRKYKPIIGCLDE